MAKPLGDRLVANLSELVASVAPMEAIIIGSIGVLAHCCEIQWKIFNQALAEMYENGELTLVSGKRMEKKVFWEKEPYIESLTSTGGPNRLKAFFKSAGFGEVSDELCRKIHGRKSELFVDYINKKGLTLRPGI